MDALSLELDFIHKVLIIFQLWFSLVVQVTRFEFQSDLGAESVHEAIFSIRETYASGFFIFRPHVVAALLMMKIISSY